MVNYEYAKIYKIVDNTNGNEYVGSTCCKLLCQRLRGHKSAYKAWLKNNGSNMTSYDIIKNDDYYIELIENVKCKTKDELSKRERHWITTLKCVNKNVPYRPQQEQYEAHKIKIKIRHKNYFIKNNEALKKKANDRHRSKTDEEKKKLSDSKIEYRKRYYEKNKLKASLKTSFNYCMNKIEDYEQQLNNEFNIDLFKKYRAHIEKNNKKFKEYLNDFDFLKIIVINEFR